MSAMRSAGSLRGYRGLTREAYALDLRQFIAWCAGDRGSAPMHGIYRYAEQEGLAERSPATHIRGPRLDYASHATGLDRNEVGALLVAAGLASAAKHTLVSGLAINGLRASEAIGADIGE